jgi:hypothetical protein
VADIVSAISNCWKGWYVSACSIVIKESKSTIDRNQNVSKGT